MSASRFAPILAAVALVPFLPAASDAGHPLGTGWTMSGNETVKINKTKQPPKPLSGVLLGFDTSDNFTLIDARIGSLTGTVLDKRGRKFTGQIDQASIDEYQAFLVDEIKTATGASSVTITKWKLKINGSSAKDGQSIKVTTKATVKGTATVAGFTVKGKAIHKTKTTGVLTS